VGVVFVCYGILLQHDKEMAMLVTAAAAAAVAAVALIPHTHPRINGINK